MAAATACGPQGTAGFRGYAFVANEDGQAVAAVDLQAMAVAKYIPLDGSPSEVVAAVVQPLVYALTPGNGSVHEIQAGKLSFSRKLTIAASAVSMRLDPQGRALYVLTREPRALVRVALDSFRAEWRIPLADEPTDFAVASDGKTAAVSLGSAVRFADLNARRLGAAVGHGDFGAVRFLPDGRTLIAANRAERVLSLYDVASARLIAHLPVAVRPDNLCFNSNGGQLFVTGEGLDAVVVVFPYHTPEVFETVLAGHGPGPMAASQALLFVASPQSGNVSILDIETRRMIAVVSVGSDPGFVTVTPDDQYALVLNRKSGDVAVLRVGAMQVNRVFKRAPLLTVIPVGSRPVSAAVRPV